LSFTYETSQYHNNIGQYTQGGSGRRDIRTTATRQNINYVWVKGSDGDIIISLNSYYVDAPRLYFITYVVQQVSSEIYISGSTNNNDYMARPTEPDPMERMQFNNSNPVQWSYTNDYKIRFDPMLIKFGNNDVDSDWLSYYKDYYFGLGLPLTRPRGKAYWIRFIMDVRDASGRRIHLVDNDGNEHRVPQKISDIVTATRSSYSAYNWDSVFEVFQVPTAVDNGTGIYVVPTNVAFDKPSFEALTPYPLSMVE
jgi:hypothetical protein